MFIATKFTIVRTWKLPKCPSTNEWVKKIRCVCVCVYITMGYYSTIRNELMPFAATWMNIEIIILSDVSHVNRYILLYIK